MKQARRKIVKVQRRIWFVEFMFWPAVVLAFVLTAVAGVRWLQRRRAATTSAASE